MLFRLFAVVCLLLATGYAAAQAYRWVDENGVVHYSDRPREGAEEVVLPRDTRASRPAVPAPAAAVADEPAPAPAASQGYTTLEVVSPAAEETLWNIGGTLRVDLNVVPGLMDGHRIRLYFDGEPRIVGPTTSFEIGEVYRGVHNIQVEVLDAAGEMMIRSRTNRFYVQQTSVISRAAPGAPR